MKKLICAFSMATLLLLFFGFFTPASAVNYNVTFCVKAELNFEDESGGDFWNGSDQTIHGVFLRVREGLVGTTVFLDYTDAETGCTPAITLSSTKSYSINMRSEAMVDNNNEIDFLSDTATPTNYIVVLALGYTPTASGTVHLTATDSGEHVAQVTAAAAYAINKRYGGTSYENYNLFNGNSGCCAIPPCVDDGSCARLPGVYLTVFGKLHKFDMAHELGHAVGIKRDESRLVNINELDNNSHFCDEYPPDADPPETGHDYVSIEWQNTGAKEGFAHFYAATIWNSINESSCEFYYYKDIDYDKNGEEDDKQAPPIGPLYNCNMGSNYLETWCGSTYTNRSIEVDWLRFWWELLTDGGETFGNIADVWDEADPGDWQDDGVGVYSSLWDAADDEGVNMTLWDAYADTHGVDH